MSGNKSKVYTSSIPEIAAKQKSAAKEAIRQQLPLIIECLIEDDEALAKLSEAIGEKLGTKKMKITNTSGEDNPKK